MNTPDAQAGATGSTIAELRIALERTQQSLVRAEERLDLVIAGAKAGMWEWSDTDGAGFVLNGSLLRLLRLDAGQRDGTIEFIRSLVHERDQGRVGRVFQEAADHGTQFETEFRMLVRGEGYRYMRASGAVAQDSTGGDAHRLVGLLIDIHERKELEEANRLIAEQLGLVIQGANAGVWDYPNLAEDYIEFTPSLQRLLGYEPGELAHSIDTFRQLTHPDDRPRIREMFDLTRTCGEPFAVEFRINTKQRGYRWVLTRSTLVCDAEGRPYRLTGALFDVHERRQAEDRLAQTNVQLDRFAFVVAHDLTAPLRHLKSFAEILRDDYSPRLDVTALSYLDQLSRSSQQLSDMIDELLEYSRTGSSALHPKAVDLAQLVSEVRETLALTHTGRRIDWSISRLPSLVADEVQLKTLLQNLLANAIKYTRNRERAAIAVTCLDDDETSPVVKLQVKDNGAGFDPADANRIFEAFERAHTEEEFEGSGIGLATVARIVARHGGHISAVGTVGAGAAFTLVLPRAQPGATDLLNLHRAG